MNNLIWIHNKATGTTSILYTDNDEYIARRNGYNGNPGLVVYINNSVWQERWVPTNWNNAQIKDLRVFYMDPTTQSDTVKYNVLQTVILFGQSTCKFYITKNEAVLKDSLILFTFK
jgi:hypothetical protein